MSIKRFRINHLQVTSSPTRVANSLFFRGIASIPHFNSKRIRLLRHCSSSQPESLRRTRQYTPATAESVAPPEQKREDVSAVKRVLAMQDGLLVGHSYGGAIITEAGNDSHS